MTAILHTDRLVLRELNPTDLDFVAAMLAHPDVSRHYDGVFTSGDAEKWMNRQVERYRCDGHGLWLASNRRTGEPVGQIGLALQEVEGVLRAEIGWLLERSHWGRGYATEGARAVRDAARDRWNYGSVISLIRPANLPSQRVALRIGQERMREVEFNGATNLLFEQQLIESV